MSEAPCKVGDRIRLIEMGFDPCPIPPGIEGTVISVTPWTRRTMTGALQERSQIAVRWDIDRSLSLIWPVDSFEVIE